MSFTNFFTGKRNVKQQAVAGKPDYSQGAVRAALEKAFARMQSTGTDRIVLSVVPDVNKESKQSVLGFQEVSKHAYHAEESLPLAETSMMKAKKPYQVIALVSDGVMGRDGISVEVVDRIPIYVFTLVNPNRYSKAANLFISDDIAIFVKANSEQQAVSSQEILAAIEPQVAEYKLITARLFEKSGVYAAVEKLEAREFATKTDEILHSLRAAIAAGIA